MKKLALFFFVTQSIVIFGQIDRKWQKFTSFGEVSGQYFLVELDDSNRKKLDQCSIIRKLDASHYIVRSKKEQTGFAPVNNDWKLILDPEDDSGFYYVVGTDTYRPAQFTYRYKNTYILKLSKEALHVLKKNPDVVSITNNVADPRIEARVIDMNLNPNRVNKLHHYYPSLDGTGELISIQENSFRPDDIDLLDRRVVTGLESELSDNHADEMATIIAGAGNSFVTGEGVARNASITSSDFAEVLPDPDSYYQGFGITVQNHSYGITQDTSYLARARSFDESAYDNFDLLHVFSSGNEGNTVPTAGVYKGIEGYANLTGDIKMTKNSLVVGSVDTVGNEIIFASRGPTYDGRVKPEVVAYGVVGSSNSAALVSGVSALLQQKHKELTGEPSPSALLKALLVNGAIDVGSPGLDFVTGYGSIDAYQSLRTLEEGRFFSGSVAEGETYVADLNLPPKAKNLKVTICWLDPPANVGDAFALVNDLDLRLKDGAGMTSLPWVLNPGASIAELSAEPLQNEDHLNNLEQVTVSDPLENYTIEVEGHSVEGSQEFYIAYQYDIDEQFEWDYPTGSDNMPYNGETGSYFRWSTTYSGSASLHYSMDGGVSWLMLDDNVSLDQGFWRWNNPPLNGDSAIARISVGTEVFETEVFTLSAPFEAEVGFNCADSALLKWDPIASASNYTVFKLGARKLEEVLTTEDTAVVIRSVNALTETRFAIQPNLSESKSLLSTPTFDLNLQGIDCYVFSFFQTVKLDTGIVLNLNLGTTYGVGSISFQRSQQLEYVTIETLENPTSESITFLDKSPVQGYNEHRALIQFINGEVVELSAGTSFYLTEVPILTFPSVISKGQVLTVVTTEFEDLQPLFELLDSFGRVVFSKNLENTQDFVEFPNLQSGAYFYRIYADGNVYTDRILIR